MMNLHTIWTSAAVWMIAVGICGCPAKPPNSEAEAVSAVDQGTIQEIRINIKGEYVPSQVLVKKGKLLRMVFMRNDNSSCTEYVVLEDFKIKQKLEPFKETAFDLMPDKEGEFPFVCGMGMLQGKLVVK
jgi:plastocyanin domain-containing protein